MSAAVAAPLDDTAAPVAVATGLSRTYAISRGPFSGRAMLRAVDGVSFTLMARETLGVVGESGCGKSMTALSVMRLVPDPPGRIVGGTVALDGRDLLDPRQRS